jgi:hypothetical protein
MEVGQIVGAVVWTGFIVGPVVVVCTLMPFTLASCSALLNLGTASQALLIRGFRHYDPVLLQRYRWGSSCR